ncbi:hypothetical protein NDU88_005456 [Pleurodeles waltl]|uniref:Uncharacterized protein n=1 Tax=Pleurodeles waltl TaxID=8319 RepID=A0AAV7X195_PLEWA|nr:hypothetical protein NDU88_005456 [Pleurodeles waltl]
MRGQAHSLIAGKKKEVRAEMGCLKGKIVVLKVDLHGYGTGTAMHALILKEKEYRDMAEDAARKTYILTQSRFYDMGIKLACFEHG